MKIEILLYFPKIFYIQHFNKQINVVKGNSVSFRKINSYKSLQGLSSSLYTSSIPQLFKNHSAICFLLCFFNTSLGPTAEKLGYSTFLVHTLSNHWECHELHLSFKFSQSFQFIFFSTCPELHWNGIWLEDYLFLLFACLVLQLLKSSNSSCIRKIKCNLGFNFLGLVCCLPFNS